MLKETLSFHVYFQVYFTLYFYVYFLIYIYQSYTNYYYNNNHYPLGNLFLPVLCACCPAGVFPVGSRSLLKLSQAGKCWLAGRCWQAGKCWERCRRWSGVGGCSHKRITGTLPWYRGIFCRKNNGIEPDGNS